MIRKPKGDVIGDVISPPIGDLALLPAPVAKIRDKILAATETGDVEALRIPIDWNETRPLFAKSGAFKAGTDPDRDFEDAFLRSQGARNDFAHSRDFCAALRQDRPRADDAL